MGLEWQTRQLHMFYSLVNYPLKTVSFLWFMVDRSLSSWEESNAKSHFQLVPKTPFTPTKWIELWLRTAKALVWKYSKWPAWGNKQCFSFLQTCRHTQQQPNISVPHMPLRFSIYLLPRWLPAPSSWCRWSLRGTGSLTSAVVGVASKTAEQRESDTSSISHNKAIM